VQRSEIAWATPGYTDAMRPDPEDIDGGGRSMNGTTALATVCGLYCGGCEFLEKECAGCGRTSGKPFWTKQYGVEVCPLYGCCVEQKGLEHCGLCDDFPCETFASLRDPSLTDEQFEESLKERKRSLTLRREMGTEAWLERRR
jgi:hypothetical protein